MSNSLQWKLVKEKEELDEKIRKLDAFLDSEEFSGLGSCEKGRLTAQFDIMNLYSYILDQRILFFTE